MANSNIIQIHNTLQTVEEAIYEYDMDLTREDALAITDIINSKRDQRDVFNEIINYVNLYKKNLVIGGI